MATTQLADVIIPELYAAYQEVNSVEKTAVFESGIVTRNPLLDQKANSGGKIIDVPFWNDIDASVEPNLSSDNPATTATPNKITAGMQVGRVSYLNQGWSAADLAGEIAGSDPMTRIAARTGAYWQKQFQKRLLKSTYGIMLDNIANNSSDMVYNIASESVAGQSASTRFNATAFLEAAFTMGDSYDSLSAIAVHSAIYKQMLNLNLIDFIKPSDATMDIPTYMGKRIIIDDGNTVVAGTTDGFKYVSILFGAGAFGYGEGSPRVPVEVQREAAQGNGAGVETLWERKTWLLHPFGFKFDGTTAGESASLTELAAATSWSRVVGRDNVPLAFLVTN